MTVRGNGGTYVTDQEISQFSYLQDVARQNFAMAEAYANLSNTSVGPRSTTGSVLSRISAVGFNPAAVVQYAEVPIGLYLQYKEPREIQHVVFFSFGQSWHADMRGGGWLNSTALGQGAVPWDKDNQTYYVAAGSEPDTLYHPHRYITNLQQHASNAATQPVHFLINRRGDLCIVNDCNVSFNSNGDLRDTCLSVALEEVLYTTSPTRGGRNAATWNSSGSGNTHAMPYSSEQLQTLAVLVRKLELAYPELRKRNTYSTASTVFMPGYVNGDALSKAGLNGATQFTTGQDWEALFAAVDTFTNLTERDVFVANGGYSIGTDVPTASNMSDPSNTLFSGKLVEQAQIEMLARKRAYDFLNMNKTAHNFAAADGAQRRAILYATKAVRFQEKLTRVEAPMAGLPDLVQPDGAGVAVV